MRTYGKTERDGGSAALKELLVAIDQAHELASDGVAQGDARFSAVWSGYVKFDGGLELNEDVTTRITECVRAVSCLRNHETFDLSLICGMFR